MISFRAMKSNSAAALLAITVMAAPGASSAAIVLAYSDGAPVVDIDGVIETAGYSAPDVAAAANAPLTLAIVFDDLGGTDATGAGAGDWRLRFTIEDSAEIQSGSLSDPAVSAGVTQLSLTNLGYEIDFTWSAPSLATGDVIATITFLAGDVEAAPSDGVVDLFLLGWFVDEICCDGVTVWNPLSGAALPPGNGIEYDLQGLTADVPLPASALLLLGGLGGLAGVRRMRRA